VRSGTHLSVVSDKTKTKNRGLALGTRRCGRSEVWHAPFLDGCEEGLFVFAHFVDERLIAGAFVSGGPQNHFGENGGEVESLRREQVDEFAAIGGVRTRGDNAIGFETAEAVGEDVRSGALVGVEEFLKVAGAAEHHVADDEQRPAIAEHFDRGVEGTPGAAFGARIGFGHVDKIAVFTCNTQVSYGKLENQK
jgi:hypothetical protein